MYGCTERDENDEKNEYHTNRYSHVDVLIRALQQQQRLNKSGIPCPELLTVENNVLHCFSDEIFIIMRFCPGKIVKPKDINIHQMYDLGCVTGKMHRILNNGFLSELNFTQFIPPSREERISYWIKVLDEAKSNGKTDDLLRLVVSLRLLWYLESVWWIHANMELHNEVQARFAEEMTWLAQNDERLPIIVGDL